MAWSRLAAWEMRRLPEQAVRAQRRTQQAHVRGIGADHLVQALVVADRIARPEPDAVRGLARAFRRHPGIVGGQEFDRHVPRQPALGQLRLVLQRFQGGAGVLGLAWHIAPAGTLRHLRLMLEAFLMRHERGGEVEDLLAVLDGDHAPGREAAAVARAVDLEDDRDGRVARPDEIAVQRVATSALRRCRRPPAATGRSPVPQRCAPANCPPSSPGRGSLPAARAAGVL